AGGASAGGASAGVDGAGEEPTTAPGSTDATTLAPTTSTTTAVVAPAFNTEAPGAETALAFAESQIGKPYQWGGAGPASYDCSGLTMVAWERAGVSLPHSAQDQYDLTERVPLSDLLPGDLVFFGTPTDVYHVGMYVGDGEMVDAPETGQDVSVQPIYELNLLAGGRIR
ncbi:MAG TPA: C40 family peptidase, partial [Acidimicrobiales bacterium]|nr:C40 family peptidase [Acidimicrobiales bacterium]